MKKIILIVFAASFMSANAQSFKKGQVDLNIGLGLGNTYIGSSLTTTVPALSIVFDYGVSDAISAGLYIGYTKAKFEVSSSEYCNSGNGVGNFMYTFTDTYTWSYTIIGVRGAYHFASLINNDKVDLYAGLILADNIVKSSVSTVTNPFCDKHFVIPLSRTDGGALLSGFIGMRYRFTDHVGLFGELGYGITYLNLGLNVKL